MDGTVPAKKKLEYEFNVTVTLHEIQDKFCSEMEMERLTV